MGKKERTDDVVTGDVKDKNFKDMMLSESAKLGFDLFVQSKSGTGKTAVYVVRAPEMVKTSVTVSSVWLLPQPGRSQCKGQLWLCSWAQACLASRWQPSLEGSALLRTK